MPPLPHSGRQAASLVLASTSSYRRQLLERLGLPFVTAGPDIDESAQAGEDATRLTRRLARAKAEAVAHERPGSVVIGADQLASCADRILGKPGTAARAEQQLRALSGRRVTFNTAVHVIRDDSCEAHLDVTTVYFRTLREEEIRRYVARERPLDCAGGFKAEALGISLFERIESQDPTALIGLPLIWLAGALRRQGFDLP